MLSFIKLDPPHTRESIAQCFSHNEPVNEMNTVFKDYTTPPVFTDFDFQFKSTRECGHGRIENRFYFLVPDVSWLSRREEWVGLESVGMVISSVTNKKTGEKSIEPRFYINSFSDIDRFANAVRSHWACESGHWVLDNVF